MYHDLRMYVMRNNQRYGVKRPLNINLATSQNALATTINVPNRNQHPGNHTEHSDVMATISRRGQKTHIFFKR